MVDCDDTAVIKSFLLLLSNPSPIFLKVTKAKLIDSPNWIRVVSLVWCVSSLYLGCVRHLFTSPWKQCHTTDLISDVLEKMLKKPLQLGKMDLCYLAAVTNYNKPIQASHSCSALEIQGPHPSHWLKSKQPSSFLWQLREESVLFCFCFLRFSKLTVLSTRARFLPSKLGP